MNRLEDTFLLEHMLRFDGLDNWPSEVPVMSQVNEFIPFICQVPFDYLFRDDPAAMAECTLLVQEYLDLDELFGNLDIYNFEGESIGAAMGFYADHVPDFDRNNYLIRGEADLDLVYDPDAEDGADELEAGISIMVQPPGKKLQNIMQLSGGEKALTAIALLFAIQSLKPSPFCLLDEIEAALDDSNVIRFAGYLHKLTDHTQFIVITHRRGTMESADRLYGVTMQEKGITKLVSVDLVSDQLS